MITTKAKVWFTVRDYALAPFTFALLLQYIVIYTVWNLAFRRHWVGILVLLPLVVPFIIQNVVYNATVGWVLFNERPFTWFFSDRLTHYYYKRTPRNLVGEYGASRMVRVLNWFDPGHI